MAYPIKTYIMRAIKEDLEAILLDDNVTPLFKKVIRNPSKPIDHDYFLSPSCFVFDEGDSAIRRNRIANVTFPVQIEAWLKVHENEVSDEMDMIQAEVHKKLASSTNVRLFAKDIEPDPTNTSEKFFIGEFLGGVAMRYIVKYLHVWGDPYDIGRQD